MSNAASPDEAGKPMILIDLEVAGIVQICCPSNPSDADKNLTRQLEPLGADPFILDRTSNPPWINDQFQAFLSRREKRQMIFFVSELGQFSVAAIMAALELGYDVFVGCEDSANVCALSLNRLVVSGVTALKSSVIIEEALFGRAT